MKNGFSILIIAIFNLVSCTSTGDSPPTDTKIWKLGWRMIESSMDGNDELASVQFDSLLSITDRPERKFLVTGLEAKIKVGQEAAALEILSTQEEGMLTQICYRPTLASLQPCNGYSEEVENEALQMELLYMYLDDQAVRGNIMEDLIKKYSLDSTQMTQRGAVGVGESHIRRLREIFAEYGFPNRKMVGRDAMYGVFMMIQHADSEIAWQRAQLEHIEAAVKRGDLEAQSYAYLYDRTQVNSDEKQRYGTQFAHVDPVSKTVELQPVEDPENLDERRREMGLMPIEMYKRFVFKSF